jgi:hypothetical protein
MFFDRSAAEWRDLRFLYARQKPRRMAGAFVWIQLAIVLCRYRMYMHRTGQPLHEVIGRPGSGELHVAILQLLAGA